VRASIFVRASALLALLSVVPCLADTIHLKNGRTIVADRVREKGDRVEYEIGDDTYAIPRSAVASISAGGTPLRAVAPIAVPEPAAADTADQVPDLSSVVIRNGGVDQEMLDTIARRGDDKLTAAAYYSAGRYEHVHNNSIPAASYMKEAVRLAPDSPLILEHYAVLLLETGRQADALAPAEHAARVAPRSADAQMIYGYALYQNDHTKDAIDAWKRSLEQRPNDEVEAMVKRAERELKAEAGYGEEASSHFTLRYEGAQAPVELRRDILRTLEQHYTDLALQFGDAPQQAVVVILYPEQTFFDVTKAPSWSAAMNDGKLRIPLKGMTAVNPELSQVLRHELAHSFINAISRGHCPLWLHEGIAQLVEGKTTAAHGRLLAQAFTNGHYIALNQLEGSFLNLTDAEAILAYDEALAVTEYLNQTYGFADIVAILQRIAEGASTEAALRASVHEGYNGLESDLTLSLKKKYGE
jgi:tetratricopeptide (TPR) repeat protein